MSENTKTPTVTGEDIPTVLDSPESIWSDGTDKSLIVGSVYRGQYGPCDSGRSIQTHQGAITFSSITAAAIYACSGEEHTDRLQWKSLRPRIIEANIIITNPVINAPLDPFMDLSHVVDLLGWERALELAQDFEKEIKGTDSWQRCVDQFAGGDHTRPIKEVLESNPAAMDELAVLTFNVLDTHKWVGIFKEKGYDGAIHGCYGFARSPEVKVFSPHQVLANGALFLTQEEIAGIQRWEDPMKVLRFDDEPECSM